jgi:hypothetical protein
MGSAQVGKTTIANVFTCGTMALGKGTFLYAHPTEDNAQALVEDQAGADDRRHAGAARRSFRSDRATAPTPVLYKERRDGNLRC